MLGLLACESTEPAEPETFLRIPTTGDGSFGTLDVEEGDVYSASATTVCKEGDSGETSIRITDVQVPRGSGMAVEGVEVYRPAGQEDLAAWPGPLAKRPADMRLSPNNAVHSLCDSGDPHDWVYVQFRKLEPGRSDIGKIRFEYEAGGERHWTGWGYCGLWFTDKRA